MHIRLPRATRVSLTILAALLLASPPPVHGQTSETTRVDETVSELMASGTDEIGVILHFVDAPTEADGRRLLDAGFGEPLIRYQVIPAVYAVGPADAVRSAIADPRITFAEHDAEIPYALDRATVAGRAKQIWDATYQLGDEVRTGGITGRGVGIAIVDTGIDATHPDLLWGPLADAAGLEAKTIANFRIFGRDSTGIADAVGAGPFLEAQQLAVDVPHSDNTGGHGTHVAGIATGTGAASERKYRGAAPGADLVGYGAGDTLVIHSGLAAFDHLHLNHAELGVRIVNNSWGGAGDWDPERAITKAIRRLVNEDGLVMVFAAGNSGGNGSDIQSNVWGNIPEVVQVANYYDHTGWLDGTSSRGRRDLEHTWPDLAAPGTEIISTAATAGPVSYFGSAQDALISELLGYGEPIVVPAPIPVTIEESVAGKDVVVGNYASLTGTSMASPFVAGVAALVLEANPDLDPFQVREILRETANLPAGRSYEQDGFAVGKGVVDAAEAVAVALKTAEGLSVFDALREAYVDTSTDSYRLNMTEPRLLEITEPTDGATVEKDNLIVRGTLRSGPLTDNTIPLAPVTTDLSPVRGTGHVYQAGVIDPFVGGGHTVLPGEPLRLSVRGIASDDGSIVPEEGDPGRHVVGKDGDVVDELTTSAAADSGALRTDSDWTVPVDASGDYVFDGFLTVDGVEYHTASLPFTVGPDAPAGAQTAGTPFLAQSTLLTEDFEADPEGWTVEQNGIGPGQLTDWTRIDGDSSVLTWAGAHSGSGFMQAGVNLAAPALSGVYYSDLADVTLVSPEIDLTDSSGADLSYWRAGGSETGFDFLEVYADPVGGDPPVLLEQVSGSLFVGGGGIGGTGWEQPPPLDLTSVAGQPIQLRFRFVSDELTLGHNAPGWSIDDVTVTSTEAQIAFAAEPDHGLGTLTTTFTFDATDASEYRLDFGDGGTHRAVESEPVDHTYSEPGQYEPLLVAFDDAGAELGRARLSIDVAPIDRVQLRLTWDDGAQATPWVDATPSPRRFQTRLDLREVPTGAVTVQARHFGDDLRRIHDEVAFELT